MMKNLHRFSFIWLSIPMPATLSLTPVVAVSYDGQLKDEAREADLLYTSQIRTDCAGDNVCKKCPGEHRPKSA